MNNYGRIVGGKEARKHSWPSMALVYFKYALENGQSNSSVCGGLLYSKNRVLTAAHCIPETIMINGVEHNVKIHSKYPTKQSMFTVYLGVHDKRLLNSNNGVQTMEVSKIIVVNFWNFFGFKLVLIIYFIW